MDNHIISDMAVADLRKRPDHEKNHTDEQVQSLCESITKFGFNDPLEVTTDGLIITGVGRWLAAQSLGLETVPVIVREDLHGDELKAYAIAHNQTTLATGMDGSKVLSEFSRLNVSDDEFSALGFGPDELVFMQPDQLDILNDDSIASPTADANAWTDHVAPVIKARLVFDDPVSQAQFERFLDVLRERYPFEATVAGRLLRFATEHLPETQAA